MSSKAPKSPRSRSGRSGSATPVTVENNRRARRKRAQEAKANGQPEAGPSGLQSVEETDDTTASRKSNTTPGGFGEEDFTPFVVSEEEDHKEVKEVEEENYPPRERDKGKGKERDLESTTRKRRAGEIDYDDGYANKKERMDANSRIAPWAADVDWDDCKTVAEMLHREVDAFVEYMSPSPVEDEVRSLIVNLISNAITKAYPDARILPFGSYQTKLYLPLGDIDLVIESPSMAASNTAAVLQSLANTMRKAGITDKVTIIAKAKVPIIKFATRHGRFSVDISINQTNGVKAGNMINRFLDELPALRGLVLITKAFLSQRKMNEVFTGGLGSYSIVCLAVSFLQLHPKIRRGEIDPSKNLGVLVMEFFELYGCYFRYDEVGISVRDGGSYYNKARRGWSDYRSPGLLSIEDPSDPSNDISRGSFAIARVRTTLSGAFALLKKAAYQRKEDISSRRLGRHYPLQGKKDPESVSILAAVMGVTQETINHRSLVQEVYDKGVLHRMLGVKPPASVETSNLSSPSANGTGGTHEATASAKAAREGAELDLESGEEADDPKSAANGHEDESRYDIKDKRQPPAKRRRIGTQRTVHTVYTSDEDEDDADDGGSDPLLVVHADLAALGSGSSGSESDSVLKEDAEYDVFSDHKADKLKKRSYWLSKAVVDLS